MPLVGFIISSLQLLFDEDVDSNGLATAALPTKGDTVVPRWDVLVLQCSSEPMNVKTAHPPPCPGKYLRFLRAFSTCTSLWRLCHSGLPIHNYVGAHRLFAAKASFGEQR